MTMVYRILYFKVNPVGPHIRKMKSHVQKNLLKDGGDWIMYVSLSSTLSKSAFELFGIPS